MVPTELLGISRESVIEMRFDPLYLLRHPTEYSGEEEDDDEEEEEVEEEQV